MGRPAGGPLRYLLDTNVVSELRRTRCDPAVRAWDRATSAEQRYVSALVLGEIRRGVEQLRARDPGRAGHLDEWLATVAGEYADHVLPVDGAVAQQWGRINAGRTTLAPDALMAATAIVHGMTLVTRNIRDLADSGALLLDPWTYGG